nr:RNA-directed DNA polymerase, eukaryota [Tanacetum cinerariifolium]
MNTLLVVVYAPHDMCDKKLLWDYLINVLNPWEGGVIMMGDFNEVRHKSARFGSVFNAHGADLFNSFIANAGVKRSCFRRQRDRYLSNHRPILLRESVFDYGPIPFCFFHYWLEIDDFNNPVNDTWRMAPGDNSNGLCNLMMKLRFFKSKIKEWKSGHKCPLKSDLSRLNADLKALDDVIDSTKGSDDSISKRVDLVNSIHNINKTLASVLAQKAKVKWSVEGDENSRFFHGILNKKSCQSNVRGVMADGIWIDKPELVKGEFFKHFSHRFDKPSAHRARIDVNFENTLSSDQIECLECDVTKGELKRAVWDCGVDKSPGPNGYTFGFYRHFWTTIEDDVFGAVNHFFTYGDFPIGCSSSFIALIPKIPNANMVKDFRPISLIGSIYKIIAKILANRLVSVLGGIVNEVQSTFIAPTEEFQFYKGLKQSDPLSPFLFILVMKSLHISFQRVVDAGLFTGIKINNSIHLSHMFFADDAVFVGRWSDANIDILVNVLDYFNRASGLKINMCKSKIIGIHVEDAKVKQAASKIGCLTLHTPFNYLGLKVGEVMSRVDAWKEVINKVKSRLSKWKMKSLSIGGRLTLIKFVLGSLPIYYMSIYRVPNGVIQELETIRSHFFNGCDTSSKKASWVRWSTVLTAKNKGGPGVASMFALNRGLMLKWIWRFFTQKNSLWATVIKAIHDKDGGDGKVSYSGARSCLLNIVKEAQKLKNQGIDFFEYLNLNLGDGSSFLFWEDCWYEGRLLKHVFPRLYTPEMRKNISVKDKFSDPSLDHSFRRPTRGGVEQTQYNKLLDMRTLSVSTMTRWVKCVPIKVNIFAWKVKMNAIPTRFNISLRGIDIGLARQLTAKLVHWWNISYGNATSYEEWLSWLHSVRISLNLKAILEGVAALVSFLKLDVLKQYVAKIDEEIQYHLQTHWHGKNEIQSFRRAKQDIEYEGFLILKGWQVLLSSFMTYMDSDIFENLSKFDPSRFEKQAPSPPPFSYIAFGGGPRMCPGTELSKMETLAMIHQLVTQFTWELVKKDESFKRLPMNELLLDSEGSL